MPAININKVADIQQHNIQDVVSQGSIKLGDRKYSVTLVNDQIKVHRQDLGGLSIGQKIANGVKDFFSRLFNDGTIKTRTTRLEGQLQGMLQTEKAQQAKVAQRVQELKAGLQESRQLIQGHTQQNFAQTCAQCMTDKPEVEAFVLNHLNDPDYSKAKFTGIADHPNDPSKFIAKFGDKQIEFSNRISTNLELRGESLKNELTKGNYQNLGELIGKNHLTAKDSMLVYCFTPPVLELMVKIEAYPQNMKNQIIATIGNEPMGNTTVGKALAHLLHPQLMQDFKANLQETQEALKNHTPQNHAETCAQCMSDKPDIQQFLLDHLNDPDYSKANFTGVEAHPDDPSKFIAKFGDKQIEFSNRISSNLELRGERLKDGLMNANYQNLDELIGKDYLTATDSMLLVGYKFPVETLMSQIRDYPPVIKNQIIASISDQQIGNTTIGEAFAHVFNAHIQ